MAKEKNNKEELHSTTKEVFEKLDDTVAQSEQFFEKHLKNIIYVFVGVLVLIIGYFGYTNYFQNPRNNDAINDMAEAENFFFQDSIKKALNGGGAYMGFEQIIEEYGNTNAGNTAKYYAAISYYKLKKYAKTIETMQSFNPKGDEVLASIKSGVIADAWVQKKDFNKALENYDDAIKEAEELETLFVFYNKKAGIVAYSSNKKAQANGYFKAILDKYPNNQAKDEIEKYAALTQ